MIGSPHLEGAKRRGFSSHFPQIQFLYSGPKSDGKTNPAVFIMRHFGGYCNGILHKSRRTSLGPPQAFRFDHTHKDVGGAEKIQVLTKSNDIIFEFASSSYIIKLIKVN
jgi:hypothetical protein